ncbi:hypothetical protein FNW02_34370 [Komarekiella sp. 'clone 1']|uniref:Uncharacterized protein n=1 Tax=Komarekiella delphini-convector SJRDD-AB1 TaxID=2593771 RepID=A0AA40T4V9_9NOST|nr:hypothetical protein [Komarekiella delphini-convector]MBD6620713.1 hypothetical protein [Komarekiella delphini-convector SJRDD-AB1]
MRHKLNLLKQGLIKIKNKLSNQLENTKNDQRLIGRIKSKIDELQNKLLKIQHKSEISSGTFSIANLDTLGFQIISQENETSSEEENKKQDIDISDFTLYQFESAAKHYLKTRRLVFLLVILEPPFSKN